MSATIRDFFSLCWNAKSTYWPGRASLAINLLLANIIIAIAQFAATLALGIKLLQLSDTETCRKALNVDSWVHLPITYANLADPNMQMNMSKNSSKGCIVYATILLPTLLISFLVTLCLLHFRAAGVANRISIFLSLVLLCVQFLGIFQDTWLGPDVYSRNSNTFTWCWRTESEFIELRMQKRRRWDLGVASDVLSGLGAMCMICYLCLAIRAAAINRKDAAKSVVGQQDLSSTTGLVTPTDGSSPVSNFQSHPVDHPASMGEEQGREGDQEGELGREQRLWTRLPEVSERENVWQVGDGESKEEENDEGKPRKDSKT